MGQVALRRHGGNDYPGQVRAALDHHVTGKPARAELPVEPEQVVELKREDALGPQQYPALDPLRRSQDRVVAEQACEGGEVQRDPLVPVVACPPHRVDDEPRVEPVGQAWPPGHGRQRQRLAGVADRQVEEARHPALAAASWGATMPIWSAGLLQRSRASPRPKMAGMLSAIM
jgi:hypothetical protein